MAVHALFPDKASMVKYADWYKATAERAKWTLMVSGGNSKRVLHILIACCSAKAASSSLPILLRCDEKSSISDVKSIE